VDGFFVGIRGWFSWRGVRGGAFVEGILYWEIVVVEGKEVEVQVDAR